MGSLANHFAHIAKHTFLGGTDIAVRIVSGFRESRVNPHVISEIKIVPTLP